MAEQRNNNRRSATTFLFGQLAREDYLELRQEANQFALETEARISPLINEKRRLFNDLLTAKGNIKIYCRARPLFEDEGSSIVEYPDDYNIRVNTGDDALSNPKKDFELDRVYGPHVGQAELFRDVQPLVQSALDGYNVSIFAYGQTNSGKTHTMEGSSHDCGFYARTFEELFDLANSDSTSMSRFKFSVTVFELYNEQEKVDNPLDFSKVLKDAFQSRGNDSSKFNASHLYVPNFVGSLYGCYSVAYNFKDGSHWS
ncbi:hypothetical protein ACE6H2_020926 [Prunus campanulata]